MGLHTKDRSDQRMNALALANTVRRANHRTAKDIARMPGREGCNTVARLLRDGDEKGPLGAIPIGRLLIAPRQMGEERVQRLLRVAGVMSGDRRLRLLTQRQRDVLAAQMTRLAP
jgi:hypothetical protein